jgi:hypothetical protein
MSLRSLFPRAPPWTCRTCLQQSTVAPHHFSRKRAAHGRVTQRLGYATGPSNPWVATTRKETPAQPIAHTSKKAVAKAVKISVPPTASTVLSTAQRTSHTARTASSTARGQSDESKESGPKPKSKRKRRLLIAGVSGSLIVAGAVAFNDEARHVAVAAQRTGRVVGTLIVCVNE